MSTKFLHYRATDESAVTAMNPHGVLSRTGATVAYQQEADDKPIQYAVAYCHPFDNFSKKMGRIKSGNRLKSPNYREDTDVADRNMFREAMDAEMVKYGYRRLG